MSIIQCQQLTIGHHTPLTKAINLTIQKNEWVGIVGHNGIGKSTFFKTLLGLISPLSGQITINGCYPGKKNHLISYMPQERPVHCSDLTSGRTFIQASYRAHHWGLPYLDKTYSQRLAHLLNLIDASTYLDQPLHQLSGGQKKRIFLLQALINQPSILLLDEPLADLDPEAKQQFIRILKQIHQQTELTVLLISHDMHEIKDELDTFIHFKDKTAHYCHQLPCLKEDIHV